MYPALLLISPGLAWLPPAILKLSLVRYQDVGFRHHLELAGSCLGQTTNCETQAPAIMHQIRLVSDLRSPGSQYSRLPE